MKNLDISLDGICTVLWVDMLPGKITTIDYALRQGIGQLCSRSGEKCNYMYDLENAVIPT
jgi:hypothetical protein